MSWTGDAPAPGPTGWGWWWALSVASGAQGDAAASSWLRLRLSRVSGWGSSLGVLSDGLMIPIGRHNELDNQMAEIIYKEAAAKLGRLWWT